MRLHTLITACAFLAATLSAFAAQYRGNWKCVPLDSRTIALSGDYSKCLEDEIEAEAKSFPNFALEKVLSWKEKAFANANAARVICERRPALVGMLRDNPKIAVSSNLAEEIALASAGFWLSSTGLFRGKTSVGEIPLKNAEVVLKYRQKTPRNHFMSARAGCSTSVAESTDARRKPFGNRKNATAKFSGAHSRRTRNITPQIKNAVADFSTQTAIRFP